MKSAVIFRNLANLEDIPTSHNVGHKKILAKGLECASNVTQVAFGLLESGCRIEEHVHPDMEEFYYFLDGMAVLIIDGVAFNCGHKTFLKVPAGSKHKLKVEITSQFIYWGVSL